MPGIDSFVTAMLHMDGIDLGTTFTDDAPVPKTYTAHGGAVTSTVLPKFGTASGLLVAATLSYVDTPASVDFAFPGDFTVDFWYKPVTLDSSNYILGTADDNNGSAGWYFIATNSGTPTLYFQYQFSGGWALSISAPSGLSIGTWSHIAAVRSGSSVNLYVDGTSIGSGSNSTSITNTNVFRIGANVPLAASYLNGKIDELRVSKGVARWTANFTPPTAPYDTGTGGGGVSAYRTLLGVGV